MNREAAIQLEQAGETVPNFRPAQIDPGISLRIELSVFSTILTGPAA
ncbi:MAG TPA: hypothetical protein VJM53_00350 [Burkholderiales bacterium]|nr:hypothetical protein [Burkholderiales bacterium]